MPKALNTYAPNKEPYKATVSKMRKTSLVSMAATYQPLKKQHVKKDQDRWYSKARSPYDRTLSQRKSRVRYRKRAKN